MHTDISPVSTNLFDENALLLESAQALLSEISSKGSSADPRCLGGSVGGHTRHCLEFYECFFGGLKSGTIDYDARSRDVTTERDLFHTREALRRMADCLRASAFGNSLASRLFVIENDGGGEAVGEPSSVGPELRFLLSHTVHHFALIAILLRLQGREVPEGFGIAPSTLRHQAAAIPPHQCAP